MNKYKLPTSVMIADKECEFNSDYRDILEIFQVFNDPDLLDVEKYTVALELFYKSDDYIKDYNTAITEMLMFISASDTYEEDNNVSSKPLYDWEQDFNLYIAPINKNIGFDVRGVEYLHWWTFLSAFMEMGECTFNTFVGIRDKLNHGKKLDKIEQKIFDDNRRKIVLQKRYDSTTQALLDEIMGKGV